MSNIVEIIRNNLNSKIYDGVPIAGGGGSALNISNLGDGSGIFKDQTSSEAYFKSLKPGQNIGLHSDANTITINYTGGQSSNILNLVYTTGEQNIQSVKTFLSGINISGKGIDLLHDTSPEWMEGRVFYDISEHTLAYYNDASGVTVNVGQETLVRVVNKNNSTITDGQVVYVDSAQGNRPTVKLAIATNATADKVLGVVTHTILDNENGYATLQGIVRNFNTSAYSVGDTLYLSPNISGALTNIEPSPPNHLIKVGIVLNSHSNQGMIFVNPSHVNQDLHHLHDTYILTGNLQNNDLLSYNSNSGKWLAIPNFSGELSNRINSTGNNLQTQINNINNGTGIFVSLNQTGQFYPVSNPSGYVGNSTLTSYAQVTYVNTGFVPKGRYNSFCANAGAMAPLASGGATASSVSFSNTHYFDIYSFDAASEQGVTFTFSLPDTYNSGTLKTRYFWGVASGGISGVVFGACARAYVSGDVLNQSYGPETLTTGFASASGIIFENLSSSIALNGNISGARSLITTKITRKVNDSGDVCNVSAYLYQINMQWQESYAEPQQWN